jgi:hypothetical protein
MISSEVEMLQDIAFGIRDLNKQMGRVADALELMYNAEYILKTAPSQRVVEE